MSRKNQILAIGVGAALLCLGMIVVLTSGGRGGAAAHTSSAQTAIVERGELSASVSQDGTLSYRARRDGSQFSAINNAKGTYTDLPAPGDLVGCGNVLYRVDENPVLLLCGSIPLYRDLRVGDAGKDVRQLNRNLDVQAGDQFTAGTAQALESLQRRKGLDANGELFRENAVFLPGPIRVAKVTGQLGGFAQAGAQVLAATSNNLHVQLNLDPSDQGQVRVGDRAQVTLPGNEIVDGRVAGFGRIAETPAEQGGSASDATIPTYVRLDEPGKARGLDRSPVGVTITTAGVRDALSVPATALVGRSGGGFAVEVVRSGGARELVAVEIGIFDDAGGRVAVKGDLHEGERVAVPSL